MKKRCYIYTRVSTAAQIEGYSLEAQTERLREYADYRELEIAREYCDAGKSGRSITRADQRSSRGRMTLYAKRMGFLLFWCSSCQGLKKMRQMC